MPKYLIHASYTAEGAKDLMKAGGTARRAAVQKMVEGLGGRLEAFYFAFGENDAHAILELPDNLTAAAISLAVTSSHARRDRSSCEKSGRLQATRLTGGWFGVQQNGCVPSWRGFFGLLIAAQKVYPSANAAGVTGTRRVSKTR